MSKSTTSIKTRNHSNANKTRLLTMTQTLSNKEIVSNSVLWAYVHGITINYV